MKIRWVLSLFTQFVKEKKKKKIKMGQLGTGSRRRRVSVCRFWDGKLMEPGINAFCSSSKESWVFLVFLSRSFGNYI